MRLRSRDRAATIRILRLGYLPKLGTQRWPAKSEYLGRPGLQTPDGLHHVRQNQGVKSLDQVSIQLGPPRLDPFIEQRGQRLPVSHSFRIDRYGPFYFLQGRRSAER